jgi:hypothetical protein
MRIGQLYLYLGDLAVDGWIILKYILKKQGMRVWTGLIWLTIGTGSCKHGNEPFGSIKVGICFTSLASVGIQSASLYRTFIYLLAFNQTFKL